MRKKVVLIIFLFFCIFECKKDKSLQKENEFSINKLSGDWELVTDSEKFSLKIDQSKIMFQETNEIFKIEKDSLGLRIAGLQEKEPIGYFLFSEYKTKYWYGVWGDQFAQLRKLN